jgi:hypothetical protein
MWQDELSDISEFSEIGTICKNYDNCISDCLVSIRKFSTAVFFINNDAKDSSPNIIGMIKSRRMSRAEHAARMGAKRNAYGIFLLEGWDFGYCGPLLAYYTSPG